MSDPEFFANCTTTTITANDNVQLFAHVRSGTGPTLVLIHGYPESSWEYRQATAHLPAHLPLFIPDIPGYGDSTKSTPTTQTTAYSKRSIATDILSGLLTHLGASPTPHPIILLGHDRGARLVQRIAIDAALHPQFHILGTILADIVPITVQFASFANPPVAAATFHWPFLAAAHPIPESIIAAFGGARWARQCLTTWAGQGVADEQALAVYSAHFEKTSVVAASCADYRAAAMVDAAEEEADKVEGRKIGVPTLVLFSKAYLGARYDVEGVWREWVEEGKLVARGLEGVGHFLFEEDPELAYGIVRGWVEDVLAAVV